MHEVSRYLAQYEEPEAWYTVGRMLDVSVPIAAIVREGAAGDTASTARKPSGVVMAPSGEQVTVGEGGAQAVELAEQGFYSVRLQGLGRPPAVPGGRESRPGRVRSDAVAARRLRRIRHREGGGDIDGRIARKPRMTPEDVEKKQAVWWYLFAAGAACCWAKRCVANRLSKRFGFGLS